MITYIYGAAGSGKSTELYARAAQSLSAGKRVILLVPEQTAVEAERSMARLTQDRGIPSVTLEVVSFRRLANLVFRTLGGVCANYIGSGGRTIVMWRALCECAPGLRCYKDISLSDIGTLTQMLSALDELKQCGISPRALGEASDALARDGMKICADKAADMALLLSAFDMILHEYYDDPRDDLPRLAQALRGSDFFRGADVFCDSFYGFTHDELDVLRSVIAQADNFTVTLHEAGRGALFADSLRDVRADLKRICPVGAEVREIRLPAGARYESAALRALERVLRGEALTEDEKTALCADNGDIELIECADMHEEAEAVAASVLARVRGGASFRDCAVVVRNIARWRGVIDAAFARSGIPCFMSDRTDASARPLTRLLHAALEAVGGGYRLESMTALIKTGLTGLSQDECDMLQSYSSVWRISGRRWHDEYEWNYAPGGYGATVTEEDALLLEAVNGARRKLCEPLELLFLGRATVREYCEAIYAYMERLSLDETIARSGEEEPVQLWNAVTDALDCMVTVASDLPVGADMMSKLLRAALSGVNIGRIPTCADEVAVGGADLFRPSHPKHVYLLGVSDGEFPAAVTEGGIFSEGDRVLLESQGIELSRGIVGRISDEQLYFYAAAASASHSLTLTYSDGDTLGGKSGQKKPSPGWNAVASVLPQSRVRRCAAMSAAERIQSESAALRYAAGHPAEPVSTVLLDVLRDSGLTAPVGAPLSAERLRLRREITENIYSSVMRMSNTLINTYSGCAFAHFCYYVLGLRGEGGNVPGYADVGNYFHDVLRAFCEAVRSGAIPVGETDEVCDRFVSEYTERYLAELLSAGKSGVLPRERTVYRRLSRTARLLVRDLAEEMRVSEFSECFFELPVGHTQDALPPRRIALGDGTAAEVVGRIDRVDLLRRGDELFVRVTDYKSGASANRMPIAVSAESGVEMQLMLYLYTLCGDDRRVHDLLIRAEKQARAEKAKAAGAPSAETELSEADVRTVPAGALYMSVRPPAVSENVPYSASAERAASDEESKARKSLERQGVLLCEDEVLDAMDSSRGEHFIPVKYNKKTGVRTAAGKANMLCSRDELQSLMDAVRDRTAQTAEKIRAGIADARPMKTAYKDACAYCQYKDVCRHTEE